MRRNQALPSNRQAIIVTMTTAATAAVAMATLRAVEM